LFKNLEVETDGFKFFFDVFTLEYKRANEKREIVYEFKEKRKGGAIVFDVSYSERGKKTKTLEMLRTLNREGVRITEDVLENAFRVFEKQSEVDYFINKNAKEFLKEQFNIWIYQYVFQGISEWTQERIKQLQVLKDIAFKIINFISQFEDELVKIWNKPKFVLNSNYVVTLDRIASACHSRDSGNPFLLIKKILKHPNFEDQVKEWKDLEREILGLFDDLDNSLDGWLIKSENYQALNTILQKFKERVQTIYIDPPFNKEQDADYFYSVKYKDASWITLLENRLQLARDILKDTGSIFVRCDYNGNMYVRMLMNEVFGEGNFRNELAISRSGIQKEAKNKFLVAIESLFLYAKQNDWKPKEIYEHRETDWLVFVHYPGERKENKERIVFGYKLPPPKGRHWGIDQELIDTWSKKQWVRFRCKHCGYEHYEGNWKGCHECGKDDFISEIKNPPKKVDSNWANIQSYSQDPNLPTRNA